MRNHVTSEVEVLAEAYSVLEYWASEALLGILTLSKVISVSCFPKIVQFPSISTKILIQTNSTVVNCPAAVGNMARPFAS